MLAFALPPRTSLRAFGLKVLTLLGSGRVGPGTCRPCSTSLDNATNGSMLPGARCPSSLASQDSRTATRHKEGLTIIAEAKSFLEATGLPKLVACGMVMGPHTRAEAAYICGCDPEELCPGPMAAIDEGDKIRTIYHGAWGEPMPRSKPKPKSAPRQVQWPCYGAYGVTKAQRRIKVLKEEWRYQIACLQDEWWINKVGTYGMASAQLYWGRLAGLLLRLFYYLSIGALCLWMTSAGYDFCWLLRSSEAPRLAGGPIGHTSSSGNSAELEKDFSWGNQHVAGVCDQPNGTNGHYGQSEAHHGDDPSDKTP